MNELARTYEATVGISATPGTPLPVNSVRHNGIFMTRQLDCAVIQRVQKIRVDGMTSSLIPRLGRSGIIIDALPRLLNQVGCRSPIG
jgi:hypothetical protein